MCFTMKMYIWDVVWDGATPEIETFHDKIILISHWQLRALVFFDINNKYLN